MDDGDDSGVTPTRQVVAGLVIIAVAIAAVVIAIVVPHDSSPPPNRVTNQTVTATTGAPGSSDLGTRDADALTLLARQDRLLRRGSLAAYRRTWEGSRSAQDRAGMTFANLRRLGVSTLNARYVAATEGIPGPNGRPLDAGAWTADVEIAWRLAGVDRADARSTLSYTFDREGGSVRVVRITARQGARMPIWLLGRLHVSRSAHALAAAMTERAALQLGAELSRAAVDVARVLPSWRGDLVAYAPATDRQFESLLATSPGAYARIAAVTTTSDGSRRPDAPVAIVVNPTVFDGLGPIGAHVVITHESTHVATGATTVTMPLWVAEGFADYVGVGAVDVPLSVSAQAALRDLRRHGLPRHLPSDAEFSGGAIEVAYEQAWLAMRVIARDYGRRRLVAFYEAVVHRPYAVRSAVRDTLGTSLSALTQEWRTYLKGLADGR